MDSVCHKLAFMHFEDVLAAIGYGEFTAKQVYFKLIEEYNSKYEIEEIVIEEEEIEITQKELKTKEYKGFRRCNSKR